MKLCKYTMALLMVLPAANIQALEFEASLQWSQRIELGAAVNGVVTQVQVQPGDRIKQDALLIQLDDTVHKAHVQEFQAKLASSTEAYKEAERERDRAIELYKRTVLSDHDLQVAKNGFVAARANLEHIRAQLAASMYKLKYSAVRAPFDSVVLQRQVHPGQVVSNEFAQQPLLVVAASNRMIARFMVSEDKLSTLAKDKAVRIRVGAQSYNGKIISIGLESLSDAASSGSAGYPVLAEFEPQQLLRAGLAAKVEIP